MTQRTMIAAFIVLAVAILGALVFSQFVSDLAPTGPRPHPQQSTATTTVRVMSIESYISQNISDISPVKEGLGGKYYVTKIEADAGQGTVWYEDGHSAHVADFSYHSDEGGITVTSFTLRK